MSSNPHSRLGGRRGAVLYEVLGIGTCWGEHLFSSSVRFGGTSAGGEGTLSAGVLSCLGYNSAFRIRRPSMLISGCVIDQFQKRLVVGSSRADWVVLVTMGDSPQLELLHT